MRKSQSGFSIIELMVAALIGLIGIIIIFQVFSVFEAQKRSTTGGGDAQSSLALGMHAIERDARQAGFGINEPAFFGCNISGWQEPVPGAGGGPAGAGAFTMPFLPALIQHGSATPDPVTGGFPRPDSVTFLYGSSQLAHFPPQLILGLVSPASNYRVSNRHGFELGDIIIVADPNIVPNCGTLAQVRVLPTVAGDNNVIDHSPGNYDVGGFTQQTRFNSPGLGPNYVAATTRVFNLGRSPTRNTYSISNGQLMQEPFRGFATPIMDGVVQMQVQYGKDTTPVADNVVDIYEDAAPTTAADWGRVLTLRIGLAARVGQYEKTTVSPTTISLWTGGPVWTLTDEERRYRYRVTDTIVPIRNMIWKRPTP